MASKPDDLPSDLASAYMALLAEREVQVERDVAVAEAANVRAELSDNEALIAHLELRIEKLKRELYGQRSERTARLLEQLELELEELVTTASEDELAAAAAAAKTQSANTTIRILAKGKCVIGRIWTYVRDDRPFAGPAPPAAVYYASSDRRGQHPQKHLAAFTGILQAACYNGFEPLFDPQKKVLPNWLTSKNRPGRPERQTGLPDRVGGGQAPRRAVRDRARHQRPQCRRAACRAPGDEQATPRRHARLFAA